ncbi:MAG: glycosyltransferase [Candidatus Omnitrophota bacterium]
MSKVADYEPIAGKNIIAELRLLAGRLSGKTIQNINSTAVGGGVAEILNRMVPLLRELGVDARWDVIKGGERFFQATKRFHNALHGKSDGVTDDDFTAFLETSEQNKKEMSLYGDIVFVHDPQPLILVERKSEMQSKWIWRCHIDLSSPDSRVWNFLTPYINQYDAAVFSAPVFSQKLPIRQFLVSPSIDPLSDKNKDLPEEFINSVLDKYGIVHDRPIITQVSRFDYLKDPLGVIEAFRLARKYVRCQLVLAGGTATDDPEGLEVLEKVRQESKNEPDIHVLLIPPGSDTEINALQRASDVIIQKSLKEGFGLTVSEALWKAKPVVASAVGGIPLQIKHRYSGLLCHSVEGAAHLMRQVLNNPDYGRRLGQNAKEHVRQNFLLTRHLKEYMLLFLAVFHHEDIINL